MKYLEDTRSHDVGEKGSHDVEDESSHDVEDESSHDVEDKGSHDVEDKGSHDVEDRGSHDVEDEGSHDVEDYIVEDYVSIYCIVFLDISSDIFFVIGFLRFVFQRSPPAFIVYPLALCLVNIFWHCVWLDCCASYLFISISAIK